MNKRQILPDFSGFVRKICQDTSHVETYTQEPMTPELEKLLAKAEESIKKGEVSPEFDNVDDFINDLRS